MSDARLVPPAALRDPDSWEVLRVWIAEQGLHVSLKVGCFGDVETQAWGTLLADAARHVADALSGADQGAEDREVILAQIAEVFLAEMEEPTSATRGSFVADTRDDTEH